ncbi:hypothetical protein [Urbifossiella limnaea]|uniref:Phenol degradation protein meta n=1 Tax=Urbifossiella limnaea TaxID=2528023 RepID=A0A517XYP8_9BACT|nr:hypothetical protein [Urbifossiella limnaea]QDU22636.1 hypothetical protein ETAA1_46190 [Urbifossiella limnaea]
MPSRALAVIGVVLASAALARADDDAPPDPPPPPRVPLGDRPGGMPGAGGPPGYNATWYPNQPVGGQPADLGFVRQGLNAGFPVWKSDGDMVLTTVGVRHTLFFTDAVLPDTGRPFPEQLWNLNLGLSYMHRFENGWTGMLMTGVGSPSDKPFHSVHEVNPSVGAMLRVPVRDGRDAWQFMLMYMPGGAINFPLPLASYAWNPTDTFRMNLGLPLSLDWRPTDDLQLTASYVPLLNVNARLTYRLAPGWWAFGGYEYLNESYLLADRPDNRDRFFVLEQRVVGGLRRQVGRAGTVDVTGGYSFGRRYGEGRSQWGALRDEVNVDPGPFVGLAAGLRF